MNPGHKGAATRCEVAKYEQSRMSHVHSWLGMTGMLIEFLEIDGELFGWVLYGADMDPEPM